MTIRNFVIDDYVGAYYLYSSPESVFSPTTLHTVDWRTNRCDVWDWKGGLKSGKVPLVPELHCYKHNDVPPMVGDIVTHDDSSEHFEVIEISLPNTRISQFLSNKQDTTLLTLKVLGESNVHIKNVPCTECCYSAKDQVLRYFRDGSPIQIGDIVRYSACALTSDEYRVCSIDPHGSRYIIKLERTQPDLVRGISNAKSVRDLSRESQVIVFYTTVLCAEKIPMHVDRIKDVKPVTEVNPQSNQTTIRVSTDKILKALALYDQLKGLGNDF